MISVSRLNNEEILLNPHLIEMLEATPDTVVTLTSGRKFIVKDTVQDIVTKIINYRRAIGNNNFSESSELS